MPLVLWRRVADQLGSRFLSRASCMSLTPLKTAGDRPAQLWASEWPCGEQICSGPQRGRVVNKFSLFGRSSGFRGVQLGQLKTWSQASLLSSTGPEAYILDYFGEQSCTVWPLISVTPEASTLDVHLGRLWCTPADRISSGPQSLQGGRLWCHRD